MLTPDEMNQAILDAKKELSREQFIKTLKQCSYGGEPVNMDLKGGDNFGKTNRSPTGED